MSRDGMDDTVLLARILKKLDVVSGPNERGDRAAWCPFHPDGRGKAPHQPNLSVGPRGFICHACGEKGGARDTGEPSWNRDGTGLG